MSFPKLLTIGGSDPSGGAGIQLDLKIFHQLHAYGMSISTVLTSQNSRGIHQTYPINASIIEDQLKTLSQDFLPDGIKLSTIGNLQNLEIIDQWLQTHSIPLIFDPIFESKNTKYLNIPQIYDLLPHYLSNRTLLITPNFEEAQKLSKIKIHDLSSLKQCAQIITKLGFQKVLITGFKINHQSFDLYYDSINNQAIELATPQLPITAHGTGCALSSAILSFYSQTLDLITSIKKAKSWVYHAIKNSFVIGKGYPYLNPFVSIDSTELIQ